MADPIRKTQLERIKSRALEALEESKQKREGASPVKRPFFRWDTVSRELKAAAKWTLIIVGFLLIFYVLSLLGFGSGSGKCDELNCREVDDYRI